MKHQTIVSWKAMLAVLKSHWNCVKLVKTLNLTLLPPHPEVDYSHGDFYSTMHKSPPLKIDLFPCWYMCIQVHIISVTLCLLHCVCYSSTTNLLGLSFCNTYHLVFLSQNHWCLAPPLVTLYYLIFAHSNQSFIPHHVLCTWLAGGVSRVIRKEL